MIRRLHILIFLIAFQKLFSQQVIIPYNYFDNIRYENSILTDDSLTFTGSKPYIFSSNEYKTIRKNLNTKYIFDTTDHKFERTVFRDHLIHINEDGLSLRISPLIYYFKSRMFSTERVEEISQNTRGIYVNGQINKKITFESTFLENQVFTPNYMSDFVNNAKVFPGMGRVKEFKTTGFDFAIASGSVIYKMSKNSYVHFGTAKHFIGHGYRSLLLSDNAFNYPFVKYVYQRKYLKYETFIASMMNIFQGQIFANRFSEAAFRKKNFTMQYLSVKPLKFVEVGLFNGIIWRAVSEEHPHFDFRIVNLVPFFNMATVGLDQVNNSVAGLNIKIKIPKQGFVYGQYMVDRLKGMDNAAETRSGFQVGIRYFNIAGIKNLNFNYEYNQVDPFAFTHRNNQQNYVHYNQPLAHPLSANFKENVFNLSYNFKGLFASIHFVSYQRGLDSASVFFGGNWLLGDAGSTQRQTNSLLQGNLNKVNFLNIELGYIINPSYNLQLFLSYLDRKSVLNNSSTITNYLSFGVRTAIWNSYSDF